VRLDSGDLAAHAHAVRAILDRAGRPGITIFASGNLDEHRIAALLAAGAPIDGFGVGTALDTSSDVPALDAVYKLQSYAGLARRKRSEGKATWPGAKQVWRVLDAHGRIARDTVHLLGRSGAGEPLLQPAMRGGRRVGERPALAAIRARAAAQLAALPPALRACEPWDAAGPVAIGDEVAALAAALDAAEAQSL
jgi:nicotinate phosphoribosyltransferase